MDSSTKHVHSAIVYFLFDLNFISSVEHKGRYSENTVSFGDCIDKNIILCSTEIQRV